MPVLVTPAPERARHSFASREQLSTWLDGRDLNSTSRGNIRQMLGEDPLPPGRNAKHEVEDYFLLHEASWMYHHDVSVAVPLFGLAPAKLSQWKRHLHGDSIGSMSMSTFKRLLQSGKRSPTGWWCGSSPPALEEVVDGQSVLNLPAGHATPSAAQLPDYAAVGLGALQVTG